MVLELPSSFDDVFTVLDFNPDNNPDTSVGTHLWTRASSCKSSWWSTRLLFITGSAGAPT